MVVAADVVGATVVVVGTIVAGAAVVVDGNVVTETTGVEACSSFRSSAAT